MEEVITGGTYVGLVGIISLGLSFLIGSMQRAKDWDDDRQIDLSEQIQLLKEDNSLLRESVADLTVLLEAERAHSTLLSKQIIELTKGNHEN